MKKLAAILALSVALVAAVTPLSHAAAESSGFIALKTDRIVVRAYVAGPSDAGAGVLVVHDYFGISDFTKAATDRLGAMGYRALAIDLYGGRSATTHEPAARLMKAFQTQDRRITDLTLHAGLDALKRPGRRLATLGFSVGGIEALQAALSDPSDVGAVVIVYGSGFNQIEPTRLARLQGPLLMITGALDEGSIQASVDLLKHAAGMEQRVETVVLPKLGHAYAQPLFDGGKGYSPEGARTTWRLIDDFLARTVPATH